MADKKLPFFRWYPADAETDLLYAGMTDQELGLYHRMLNRAWMNGGSLPADLDELALILGRDRGYLERVFPHRVARCWKVQEGRLVNPRQEKERGYALEKSRLATDAVRTRYGRTTTQSTDVHTRASVSVSVSEETSKTEKTSTRPRAADLNGQTSQRFEEFWGKYPRKVRKDYAGRNFISYVDVHTEGVAFACLERYLRSAEVARGVVMNPDRWLYEQYNMGWTGDWPQRAKTLDDYIEEMPG